MLTVDRQMGLNIVHPDGKVTSQYTYGCINLPPHSRQKLLLLDYSMIRARIPVSYIVGLFHSSTCTI